jgi:hypothetical protein
MKKIELKINTCSQCPYSVYVEYEDVGTSFGSDYYCKLGAKHIRKVSQHQDRFSFDSWTKSETQHAIRNGCPLRDIKKK